MLSAKPDAVFAASDVMAIGAMRAVRDAGLRIPEDIAFVGFDDLPIATFSDTQLTTIRQPVISFGAKAVITSYSIHYTKLYELEGLPVQSLSPVFKGIVHSHEV